MRKFTFAFLLIGLCFGSLTGQTTYRALFLGNSYTYVNAMPNIVASLALAGGDTLIHNSNTPGGYTLEGHSTNAASLSMIAQGDWDFVILQDQSQRPSFPPSQVAQDVYPYGEILVDSIKSANPCTEPVFFMTWGRKYGDQSNCASYPPICTYEGMQDRLKTSYVTMANANECTVAPVGMAWWQSKLQDSTLNLHSADNSHPSYNGSYLAACVFYATTIRKSPVGLNFYGSLDSATATHFQNIAHLVVFDSLDQWRIGANDVAADFDFLVNNDQVDFTDQSDNASSWMWDFGDGNTDTIANPIHVYSNSGTYWVSLVVDNGCTADTASDSVVVVIVGLADELEVGLVLAPNPNRGEFRLSLDVEAGEVMDLEIRNVEGKLLYQRQVQIKQSHFEEQISLTDWDSGIYLIKVEVGEKFWMRKLVIE